MNIIDLFSGCGGLSLGFHRAKFNILIGSDFDGNCAKTYKYNHPETNFILDDINNIDSNTLHPFIKDKHINGIIGGPPCQGFSLAGKRNVVDKRNTMINEFLRIVNIIKPDFFLIENVKGNNFYE